MSQNYYDDINKHFLLEAKIHNISSGFATIISLATLIGIIVIMAFNVEYDGSKEGGWGYISGGFATALIALVGGGISYAITKAIARAMLAKIYHL